MFCEFCGTRLGTESRPEPLLKSKNIEEHQPLPSKISTENAPSSLELSLDERLGLLWTIVIMRRVYVLLKAPYYKSDFPLRVTELSRGKEIAYALILRNKLKKEKIPEEWFRAYPDLAEPFLPYFETTKAHLKNRKVYKEKYEALFRDAIRKVIALIRGKIQQSECRGLMYETVDALKEQTFGKFDINLTVKCFGYYFSIFAARILYGGIQLFESKLKVKEDNKDELDTESLEMLAKPLADAVAREPFKKEWLRQIAPKARRWFNKEYRSLQKDLAKDQLYRSSLFDYLKDLANVIFELTRREYELDKLRPFVKKITNDLIATDQFEIDKIFPDTFKKGLKIVLARYACYWMTKAFGANDTKDLWGAVLTKGLEGQLVCSIVDSFVLQSPVLIGFRSNLRGISRQKFANYYQKLCEKLKRDKLYTLSFQLALQKLVETVFILISGQIADDEFTLEQHTINNDLMHYSIDPNDIDYSNKPNRDGTIEESLPEIPQIDQVRGEGSRNLELKAPTNKAQETDEETFWEDQYSESAAEESAKQKTQNLSDKQEAKEWTISTTEKVSVKQFTREAAMHISQYCFEEIHYKKANLVEQKVLDDISARADWITDTAYSKKGLSAAFLKYIDKAVKDAEKKAQIERHISYIIVLVRELSRQLKTHKKSTQRISLSISQVRTSLNILSTSLSRDHTEEIVAALQKYAKVKEGLKNAPFKIVNDAVFTRKLALRFDAPNKEDELKKIESLRRNFIRFRDIENEIIDVAFEELRKNYSNPVLIDRFRNSEKGYKTGLYDAPEFRINDRWKKNEFKSHRSEPKFKERAMRLACYYPYFAIRNWLIRAADLGTITTYISELFYSPKEQFSALHTFLSQGKLRSAHLEALGERLSVDRYGFTREFSHEFLINHLGQLRNLAIKGRVLDTELLKQLKLIRINDKLIERFASVVLHGFKETRKKKEIFIHSSELPRALLTRYMRSFKRATTKLAKEKLSSKEGKLKGRSDLVRFTNSLSFSTLEEFKQKRDLKIAEFKNSPSVRAYLKNELAPAKLYERIKKSTLVYVSDLVSPHRNLTKSFFKPEYTGAKLTTLDESGFANFCEKKLKAALVEKFYKLNFALNPANYYTMMKSWLAQISREPFNFLPKPKMKELSMNIISREQVFEFDDFALSANLSLSAKSNHELKICTKINNKTNKYRTKEVKSKKKFENYLKLYDIANPTLKMQGRKVILIQPFYAIKGKVALSFGEAYNPREERKMGVDLGLKTLGVASVMDTSTQKGVSSIEVVRYFLDQEALFNRKFNPTTKRFEKVATDSPFANVKYRLSRLDKAILQLQQKQGFYERTFPFDPLRQQRLMKRLEFMERKRTRLHLEIVHQLSHRLVQIAIAFNVKTIHFEDLRWSKMKKKGLTGAFISANQVHWLHGQIQDHTSQLARRFGIIVRKVNARNTSRICSECRRLGRSNYDDMVNAVRSSKSFMCTHPFHQESHDLRNHRGIDVFYLDADLNAARNIAMS